MQRRPPKSTRTYTLFPSSTPFRARRFDEAAELWARLARIDDVRDAEGLGGTEGRAVDAQLLLQLLLALLRIGRRFDLAPESDGDTALDRQRAPFRGRPGDLDRKSDG